MHFNENRSLIVGTWKLWFIKICSPIWKAALGSEKKPKPICNDLVSAGEEDSIAIFYVFAILYVLWDILQKVSQRFL